jgi:hypothetical protein
VVERQQGCCRKENLLFQGSYAHLHSENKAFRGALDSVVGSLNMQLISLDNSMVQNQLEHHPRLTVESLISCMVCSLAILSLIIDTGAQQVFSKNA